MISTSILIHGHPDLMPKLKELGLNWTYHNEHLQNEISFYIDDVPREIFDGTYQDPEEELCEHYGFDYDLIHVIESA